MIPPIFASLPLMPLTIAQFAGQRTRARALGRFHHFGLDLSSTAPPTCSSMAAACLLLLFYTAVVFNPEETAENLKKYGASSSASARRTEEYLDYVLTRVTVVGAAYLTLICLVPEFLIAKVGIPFYLGGTSLLIVVNVTMDTVTQIQSHLIAHQYGDLIKKAKLKGGLVRR